MYKQPRSVQVVVFLQEKEQRKYLLLERVGSQGGFWQSVTGSLEGDETHRQAATREVREETGIDSVQEDLVDLHLVNTFEIAPAWLHRYAPGVTTNQEVCFALRVDGLDVITDPREHTAYLWVGFETAMSLLHWQSNKLALAATENLFA